MTTIHRAETRLIRTMGHALRHDPAQYGLEPSPEGWVLLDDLIIALRYEQREWMNIESDDIVDILAKTESGRFEIAGAKIRAVYGHSIVVRVHCSGDVTGGCRAAMAAS